MKKEKTSSVWQKSLSQSLYNEAVSLSDENKEILYNDIISKFQLPPNGIDPIIYQKARHRVEFLILWWKNIKERKNDTNRMFDLIDSNPIYKAIIYFEISLFLASFGHDPVLKSKIDFKKIRKEGLFSTTTFYAPFDPSVKKLNEQKKLKQLESTIEHLQSITNEYYFNFKGEKASLEKTISILNDRKIKLKECIDFYKLSSVNLFINGKFEEISLSNREQEENFIVGAFVYRFRNIASLLLRISKDKIDYSLIALLNSTEDSKRKKNHYTTHILKTRWQKIKAYQEPHFSEFYSDLIKKLLQLNLEKNVRDLLRKIYTQLTQDEV